jgi:DNA-directed RNA polymerase specialized sigma24 family protein
MLTVCVRHAQKPYDNLGAALQTAAFNRGLDDWRRNRRYKQCPLDESIPACSPLADASLHFRQEEQAVEAALCRETPNANRIIRQRVVEGLDFATIGRELGMSADDARTTFHNALRRAKARVASACGL